MRHLPVIGYILLLANLFSCQGGGGGEDITSSQGDVISDEDGTQFVVTRDQFAASGMELGIPDTVQFSDAIRATGIVRARPSGRAEVSTLIPGRIHQIFHSLGEDIRKGEVLFALESNDYIELQQEYAATSNRVRLLEAEYKRQKTLYEQQVVAEKEFLRTESEYRTTTALMEGLKARLRMTNTDPGLIEEGTIIPYLKVRSPIKGTISRHELVMGHYITPEEVLVEIVDPAALQLYLQVFQKDMEEIEPGLKVIFYNPDRPDRTFAATLLQAGRSIDPITKKIHCTAQIVEGIATGLVDNLYVEASIITGQREVLAVPEEAVFQKGDRSFILTFIGQDEGALVFQTTQVQAGATRNGYVEILDQDLHQVLIKGGDHLWTEE
jgi:cobalt-zinc-cadmium efflux system membrane fusion protein